MQVRILLYAILNSLFEKSNWKQAAPQMEPRQHLRRGYYSIRSCSVPSREGQNARAGRSRLESRTNASFSPPIAFVVYVTYEAAMKCGSLLESLVISLLNFREMHKRIKLPGFLAALLKNTLGRIRFELM